MRKITAFILLFTFGVAVMGCSGGSTDEAPPAVDKSKDAATEKQGGAAPTQSQD